jgi:putative endonuclease
MKGSVKAVSKGWVYIARCADGTYYTGSTTDPGRREITHNNGTGAKYTRSRRPVTFIFQQEFPNLSQAVSAETRIKQWARSKKEALVNRQFDLKAELDACRESAHTNSRTRVLSPKKQSRSIRKKSTGFTKGR